MTKFRIAMNHVTDTETENIVFVFLENIPEDELPYLVRLYLTGQGEHVLWKEDEEGRRARITFGTKSRDIWGLILRLTTAHGTTRMNSGINVWGEKRKTKYDFITFLSLPKWDNEFLHAIYF